VPSKADEHGLARAMGRKMQAHRELLAPVLAAARPIHQRTQREIEANNAILAAAKLAPLANPKSQRAKSQKHTDRLGALNAALASGRPASAPDGDGGGSLYDALNED
jgi:hypothetical protein